MENLDYQRWYAQQQEERKELFRQEFESLDEKAQRYCKDAVKYYYQEEGSQRIRQAEGAKNCLEIFHHHFSPKWPAEWAIRWVKELYLSN
jgi:hypothetical protein